MSRFVIPVLGLVLCIASAQADNWPAWRGATGQGYVEEKNLPLKWSAKENVKWKVAMADQTNSTPIIWGDKIFITQANKGGTVRSLLCLAKADGKEIWKKDVAYDAKEKNWNESWYCNASATTDGERVVACFGSAGVYCYDFEGKEIWKRTDLGKWEHPFGNGASPILHGDNVIQWCGPNDGKGDNYLLAMKKKTGETVWRHDETYGSWSTPVIAKVDGKDQLLLGQSRDVKSAPEAKWGSLKGIDPKTGSDLWSCQGLNSYVYTSALFGDGVAVGMSGYGGSSLAVKLGGTGDITKDRLWMHPKPAGQRVGSGMIVGEHVYMVDEGGLAHCYELKTGKDLWDSEKLKGQTWGSMIHSDGRLYLLMKNGDTVVLAAKPKFEQLAYNTLGPGEQTNSSIAVSDGELFIRTFKNLYCISEKKK
ncbi:MAG: PQQ-like beta-propeller repeat protein [Planctomycetes bacterium]|nr:PQQ-like beta-propeller repeat protein [Planctomycetota bacterium]